MNAALARDLRGARLHTILYETIRAGSVLDSQFGEGRIEVDRVERGLGGRFRFLHLHIRKHVSALNPHAAAALGAAAAAGVIDEDSPHGLGRQAEEDAPIAERRAAVEFWLRRAVAFGELDVDLTDECRCAERVAGSLALKL